VIPALDVRRQPKRARPGGQSCGTGGDRLRHGYISTGRRSWWRASGVRVAKHGKSQRHLFIRGSLADVMERSGEFLRCR